MSRPTRKPSRRTCDCGQPATTWVGGDASCAACIRKNAAVHNDRRYNYHDEQPSPERKYAQHVSIGPFDPDFYGHRVVTP